MSFQEITKRYEQQMRETHERHARRIEEIRREQFFMGIALTSAILLPIVLSLIFVWWMAK